MKNVLFAILFLFSIVLMSCNGKPQASNSNGTDSTSVENGMKSETDSAIAKTIEEAESEEGAPDDVDIYDVSVRTFDLDSQEPGPGYEGIIRKDGKTLQVVEGRTEGYPKDMLKPFGDVWQTDINFDGHTDILICLGWEPVSDQVFTHYDAWLFNPADGKFYHSPNFRDICNPEPDRQEHRILSHYIARDGSTRVYSALYWQSDRSLRQVGKTWTLGGPN